MTDLVSTVEADFQILLANGNLPNLPQLGEVCGRLVNVLLLFPFLETWQALYIQTKIKLYFFCVHSREPLSNTLTVEDDVEAYKNVVNCLIEISKALPKPRCCEGNSICCGRQCVRSQCYLLSKSVMPEYMELTKTTRELPYNVRGIMKKYTASSSCSLCRDETKPRNNNFLLVDVCKHLFCETCFRKWASVLINQNRAPDCPYCRQTLGSYVTSGKYRNYMAEMVGKFLPDVEKLTANKEIPTGNRFQMYKETDFEEIICAREQNKTLKASLKGIFFPSQN